MKSLKLSLFAVALMFASYTASAQQAPATKKAATTATAKADAKPVSKAGTAKSPTIAAAKSAPAPAVAAEGQNMKPSDITWTEDVHNFGDIQKGNPASHEFTFKNTTKETILITNVKPSCGCTAANYTKTPIKPGETGSVTATFNAANPGPFSKQITVTTSDSDVKKVLTIKGKVETPAEAPAATPQN